MGARITFSHTQNSEKGNGLGHFIISEKIGKKKEKRGRKGVYLPPLFREEKETGERGKFYTWGRERNRKASDSCIEEKGETRRLSGQGSTLLGGLAWGKKGKGGTANVKVSLGVPGEKGEKTKQGNACWYSTARKASPGRENKKERVVQFRIIWELQGGEKW